jgi:hypothetical protein
VKYEIRISDLNDRGNCLRPLQGGFLRHPALREEWSLPALGRIPLLFSGDQQKAKEKSFTIFAT